MDAAAIIVVGINGSRQGRVHGWMTQERKASARAVKRYPPVPWLVTGEWGDIEDPGSSRIGVMLRAAHPMINPGQFVLELILVVAALALSRSLGVTQHRRFVIGFAALAAAANCAFYYFAVGPLYLARGFGRSVLVSTVIFETIRWGVLAFVLSRLATRLQDVGAISGFTLR